MRLNATGLQVTSTLSGGTSGTAYSFSGSAPATSLTLDSGGRLGIGNSTPTNYQAVANQLVVGLTGNNGITVVSGTTGTGSLFFGDGTTGTEGYRGYLQYDHSLDSINLGTNALTRATLDSSGNLGLGVTPSAWGAGTKALQVSAGTFVPSLSYIGGEAFLTHNAFYDGTNWKYTGTGYGSTRYQLGVQGQFVWSTSGNVSGTAGNTVSYTDAMTLSAGGLLSIGTTNAAGAIIRGLGATNANATYYLDADGPFGGSPSYRPILGFALYSDSGARYNSQAEIHCIADSNYSGSLAFFTQNPGTYPNTVTERGRFSSSGFFKASNLGTYNDATGLYHEFRGDTANSYIVITTCTNATPLSEYIQDFRFSAATPNNGNARFWSCMDATAERAYIRSNGGLSNYSANDTNLSDRREKTNFAPATSYLDKICAIPVQTFNYIDQNHEEDGGLTLGVVAQDVQAVAPELVTESNWARKDETPKMRLSIYQTDLQYALMKCIQEQQALITQLTARITALETA